MVGTKILDDPPLIISDKSGNTSYLRIVNSENIYVEPQPLPKLVDTVRFSTVADELPPDITEETVIKKEQEDKPDSDRESIRLI